eukprot:jgi/Mesen1/4612/ME000234S03860
MALLAAQALSGSLLCLGPGASLGDLGTVSTKQIFLRTRIPPGTRLAFSSRRRAVRPCRLASGSKHACWRVAAGASQAPVHAESDSAAPFAKRVQRLARMLPAVALAAVLALVLRPAAALAHAASAIKATTGTAGAAGSEVLVSAWAGLVAGCLHTLTGPDHLAALAPLAIGRSRWESASIGALWGCGHDAGQVLFGILFVLLKDRLQLDVLKIWGSRVVGVTLVAIGALGVFEARSAQAELTGSGAAPAATRTPGADGAIPEIQADGTVAFKAKRSSFGAATFVTGIVHGLQPDALLVVLPALALPSKLAGAAFLTMFLLGTVVAMGSYTAFIGSCSEALQKKVPGFTMKLSYFAAFLAMALGGLILAGEYFGFALF